ncbi:MAG: hypothetical protein PWP38_3047 [Clostridiales bacterium]|jgi:multimeric flavodoxin WrbA|nr:hypothetical protein [Clostridiales bacterium]
MKAIAINGSPRKTWSTATLLEKGLEGAKSKGAATEMIHLYDLTYKGCTSCFACKRKDGNHLGKCAMKDDLTSVLDAITACDVLLLGSPMYCGDVTGEMHSLLERLLFSSMTYNRNGGSVFRGRAASGFIYTMNYQEEVMQTYTNYKSLFLSYQNFLGLLKGPSEYLLACDTLQFDDYSKYEASMFDEAHKLRMRREQFPKDCQKAFNLGARLATY